MPQTDQEGDDDDDDDDDDEDDACDFDDFPYFDGAMRETFFVSIVNDEKKSSSWKSVESTKTSVTP